MTKKRDAVVLCLALALGLSGKTGSAAPVQGAQPAPAAAATRTVLVAPAPPPPLPDEVTTSSGRLYKGVELLRVDPIGLLVKFRPDREGIGLAILKFRELPAHLQQQYGYDPQAVAAYEAAYEVELRNLLTRMWAEFKASVEHRRQEELLEVARIEEERRAEEERLRQEAEKAKAPPAEKAEPAEPEAAAPENPVQ